MAVLELSTHRLAYETRGVGQPVLLLGGSGEPMVAWEMSGLIDVLVGAGHRVIWYAARGVVPSGCPPLPWSVAEMAEDAAALLTHLGVESCIAIGYSLGGFTVEELARRDPNCIDLAILMGSAGTSGTIREAFIDAENAFAAELGRVPRKFSRLMTLMTALGGPALTDERLVDQWWELLAHQESQWAPPHGEVGQAQVARSWVELGSTVGRPWPASVAVALVHFEYDVLFPPSQAYAMTEHLRDPRVEVVPGAAHAGLLTHPEATSRAILRLL